MMRGLLMAISRRPASVRLRVARSQALGKGPDGPSGNAARRLSAFDGGGRAYLFQQGSLQRRTRICRRGLRLQLKKRRAGRIRRRLSQISAGLLAAQPAVQGRRRRVAQDAYGYGVDKPGTTISVPASPIRNSMRAAGLSGSRRPGARRSSPQPTSPSMARMAGQLSAGRGRRCDLRRDAERRGAVGPAAESSSRRSRRWDRRATVTSASGGSTVIHLPPTPGQVAAAALGRQYTVPANTLPVDKGFRDHRGAATLRLVPAAGRHLGGRVRRRLFARERLSGRSPLNAHVTQNFNTDNTTVSLGPQRRIRFLLSLWRHSHAADGDERAMEAAVTSRNKTQLGFVAGLDRSDDPQLADAAELRLRQPVRL